MKLDRATKEDLLLGGLFGLLPAFYIGWWALITAVLSACFWSLGGRYGNSYQVYGSSSTVYLPVMVTKQIQSPFEWTLFSMAWILSGVVMSMGYGIPDLFDDGSTLGKFFYKLTDGNEWWANFLTRGTIYMALISLFGVTLCAF